MVPLTLRVQLAVAGIAAAGGVFAAMITGVVDLFLDDAPARESCAVIIDRVLDLKQEHPQAAALYARPGQARLPRLASPDEVSRCGEPERLLEELRGG